MAAYAILQSQPHEIWRRQFSSTLEDRLKYVASDCFDTYAFPAAWQAGVRLEQAGVAFEQFRSSLMSESGDGLTEIYNCFHDPHNQSPGIAKLRELGHSMDVAVLDAYGWNDIRPTCEFFVEYEAEEAETQTLASLSNRRRAWRYRWPDDICDEVLARLLALNTDRAAAAQLAGPVSSKPVPKRKKAKAVNPTLLDGGV
jgi:hypothetical protein